MMTMDRACLCGRQLMVTDPHQGEVVCGGCGTVIESRVCELDVLGDAGALMESGEDYGVGTLIPGASGGAGAVVTRRNGRGAVLSGVFAHLRRMADVVGAGDAIRDEAYRLSRRLIAGGFAVGRDRMVVAAAALMLACRLHGRVLEWTEIPGSARKLRRMMRVYREMQCAAGVVTTGYAASLVPRICSDLGLPVSRARDAMAVLDRMKSSAFTCGKKPQCVAAAAVVLSGPSPPTMRRIAAAARISEPGLCRLLAAWRKDSPG